ncbi:hypothetical protein LCGC14_2630220, partial [marine sediment metagenome]
MHSGIVVALSLINQLDNDLGDIMQLKTFKTVWGHTGTLEEAATMVNEAGFAGFEAPAKHDDPSHLSTLEATLDKHGLEWIQEICTAGSYVPRRRASVSEHLSDLESQIILGKSLKPKFINVMGGCDAWPIQTSIDFFKAAMEIADKYDVLCSFETHRG